jgi:rhodanese-related sulfurtransferase
VTHPIVEVVLVGHSMGRRAALRAGGDPQVAAVCALAPWTPPSTPGVRGFVLLDSRSAEAWAQGHVPGAVHLPGREIAARAPVELDRSVPVVTYCWGPGCNGATRAALALALLGFRVREMVGGFEYWAREGLPVETADGVRRTAPDPLTTPAAALSCGC